MRKFLKKLNPSDRTSSSTTKNKKNKQIQFPFLSLPPEIRDRIYFFLFDCSTGIHLFHDEDRINHLRCQQPNPLPLEEDEDDPNSSPCCCFDEVGRWVQARNSAMLYGEIGSSDMLRNTPKSAYSLPTSILYANRQISAEALETLYSSLAFFQTDNLKTWILFTSTVPQAHLSRIRSLRARYLGLPCLTMAPVRPPSEEEESPDPPSAELPLTSYPAYERYTTSPTEYLDFWDAVRTKMPGLCELGFVMDYDGQFLDRRTQAEWVRPITRLRGMKRLRVAVFDRIKGERSGVGTDVERAGREERVLNEWLRGLVCQEKEGDEE